MASFFLSIAAILATEAAELPSALFSASICLSMAATCCAVCAFRFAIIEPRTLLIISIAAIVLANFSGLNPNLSMNSPSSVLSNVFSNCVVSSDTLALNNDIALAKSKKACCAPAIASPSGPNFLKFSNSFNELFKSI